MVDYLWDASAIAAIISAALLGVFAIAVGALGKFRGPARWYALFGLGFSVAAVISNVLDALFRGANDQASTAYLVAYESFAWFSGSFSVLWVIGVVGLLRFYGVPARSFWLLVGPAIGILGLAVQVVIYWGDIVADWSLGLAQVAEQIPRLAAIGLMAVAPMALAQAHLRTPRAGQLVLAAALVSYPISYGLWFVLPVLAFDVEYIALMMIPVTGYVGAIAAWMIVLHRRGTRHALGVVGVANAFMALGVLSAVYAPAFSPSAIARSFEILVVAYGIMRLQYLDLQLKVRWGIAKGAVAAVFIAMFFIASEAAQTFFGATTGNEYYGIAAAGLLVLGIAPLQRMADRLATRAVPLVSDTVAGAEEIYRTQYGLAWSDGVLSAKEGDMLRALRTKLGITADQGEAIVASIPTGKSE